jgi:phosphoglycerate kinase
VVAIVGGAKVSTKLDLLGNLVAKVDVLVIGGGMANTFLAAQGHAIGKSLQPSGDARDTAREILDKARRRLAAIVLPIDAVVAARFKAGAPTETVAGRRGAGRRMILDVGPETVEA